MRVFVVWLNPQWVEVRVAETGVKKQVQTLKVKGKLGRTILLKSVAFVGGEPIALVPFMAYGEVKTQFKLPAVLKTRPVGEVKGAGKDLLTNKQWVEQHLKGATYVG